MDIGTSVRGRMDGKPQLIGWIGVHVDDEGSLPEPTGPLKHLLQEANLPATSNGQEYTTHEYTREVNVDSRGLWTLLFGSGRTQCSVGDHMVRLQTPMLQSPCCSPIFHRTKSLHTFETELKWQSYTLIKISFA
ncbi:Uncharacterized protein HZ326_7695 [Fusarium oxysporum f. sp. albedinis]|nr:Uncharacterized protein HZ326_7695 [Fusarium oxysporum f. sp. albedinis]